MGADPPRPFDVERITTIGRCRSTHLLRRIDERQARVVVVGQGYVGLPVAMRAVEVGFAVVGYDVSPTRIDALARGRLLRRGRRRRRSSPRPLARRLPPDAPTPATCAGFDVAVITVPTPLRDGTPDLSLHRGGGRDAGAAPAGRRAS